MASGPSQSVAIDSSSQQAVQAIMPDSLPELDDDALYGLNSTEKNWVNHGSFLKMRGYTLRPRYQPGWVPSWKTNGNYPPDCEDSWELPAIKTLDALRDKDGKHVSLKKIVPSSGDDEGHNELDILQYLAQDHIRNDPRNSGLPLLDTFPIPEIPDGFFIVTPFLSKWDSMPFMRFGELLDFIRQLIEGLCFLHSHNIAHRDAQAPNIMMDASLLYDEPFHPCDPHSSLDGARRLKVKPRSEAPVRYYFIDFGLSSRFSSFQERRLVTGVKGREQRAPELSQKTPPPYDPFKLDIFTIGMVIDEEIAKKYRGFRGLKHLIARMTARDPASRPDAEEALMHYMQWENQRWMITKRWGVVPKNVGLLRRSLICISSVLGFYRGQLHQLLLGCLKFVPFRRSS